ncbi:MAG TPA: exonuclease SbcCD subunit D [Euzebyales bacterium]|nr:exonuclease SbcCD subunit D [Euzebyales bacterium]
MRLLHTADWHVGRTIRGHSRADEHRAVLAEIAGLAEEHAVDVVLIAGDQFDTSAPSAEAEQIVYTALLDLAQTGAQVVLVAGNHDNPRRWGAITPLLARSDVHAAATVRRPDAGGVLELATRCGQPARIALVPFLSQRSIVRAEHLMDHDAGANTSAYAERVGAIIEALTAGFTPDAVNIVLGHLTVTGGDPALGGGERAAHTIFDYFVPPQSFPSTTHYVALGHLHLPHRIPGGAPIWYAGSPLALDFGEAERDHKAALLVDVTPDTPARVERLPLQAGRRLRTLRGPLDDLLARRDGIDPDAYLRIVLDEPPRTGLARMVRDEFPRAVEVSISADRYDRRRTVDDRDVHGSPHELFARYLADHGGTDDQLTALFTQLLEEEHAADAS